ncbi:calcium-binding protein [Eilatimonas milleporae]|uniref:Hemolysin type calcium-binding protein n=1 Tax=Eilatimonas milleporae TaxID=911205 RepID=A0A3M0CG59_9PROT|nr:calcium-binding protein [Eilatimonas milleporae]RMB08574.1 hemolysin type calcium-binding protein [Eilatimonas milleporae]
MLLEELIELFLPDTVDLVTNGGLLTIPFDALDGAVTNVEIRLTGPTGILFSAEADDDARAVIFDLPEYAPEGGYVLSKVIITVFPGVNFSFDADDVLGSAASDTITVVNDLADDVGPVIAGISLTDAVVDLADTDGPVFALDMSDDTAGLARATVTLRAPNGDLIHASADAVDGDLVDVPFDLDRNSPAGTYEIIELQVSDLAGNVTVLDEETLSDRTGRFFEVVNERSDTTAPALDGVSFPARLFIDDDDFDFDVDIDLLEEDAGVTAVTLTFTGPDGAVLAASRVEDDPGDDFGRRVRLGVDAPDDTPVGDYVLSSLTLVDAVGNARTYDTAELEELGFATALRLVDRSLRGDDTSPELDSLVLPSVLDVAGGQTSFAVTLTGDDGGDGLDRLALVFDGPDGAALRLEGAVSGTAATFTLPEDSVGGTYRLVSATIFDAARNSVSFDGDILAAVAGDGVMTLDNPLAGGADADRLRGGEDGDRLFGGAGDDVLVGLAGDDLVDAGEGDDAVFAGAGDQGRDTLVGAGGADVLGGGGGNDLIIGGNVISPAAGLPSALTRAGRDGADEIFGGDGDDTLVGGHWQEPAATADGLFDRPEARLDGMAAETIWGGGGDDLLFGGGGHDQLGGGVGADEIIAGGGDDVLYGGRGDGAASGPNDTLDGGNGNDLIFASGGDDLILGGADDDELFNGGGGRDTLWGGPGDDRLAGGGGRDDFIFGTDNGHDRVDDFDVDEDRLILNAFSDRFAGSAGVVGSMELANVDGVFGVRLDLAEGQSLFFTGLTPTDFLSADIVIG